MPIVSKRARKYFNTDVTPTREMDSESELLKTIKFSKNIFKLKLPQATYEQLSYATIPVHNSKSLQHKQLRNHMTSKTILQEKVPLLPKITTSTRGGNNLNNSTNSGDGDDEYEQDFETEEKRNLLEKPKSRSYSGRKDIEIKNYA